MRVSGIVMAAGFSRRMGGADKLLLTLGGQTLVERAVRLATEAELFETIVVARDVEVIESAQRLGAICVLNEQPELGQSQSVKLGIIRSGGDFYLFLPADQPFLSPKDIKRLTDGLRPGDIVSARDYNGNVCSPSVFSAEYREELLALTGDRGGGSIKKKHADRLRFVDFAPEVLRDIDSMEDYYKAAKEFEESSQRV